jgi:hypothetical protein
MNSERRAFSRIPVPWDQSATFLRAGLRQFTVHLINASPHGFCVTCPERLGGVGLGTILQIRTSEGWIETRVANIEPLDGDKYPEEYDSALGLVRLRNLGYGPDDNWLVPIVSHHGSVLRAVAVIAGLVIAGMLLPQSKPVWEWLRSLGELIGR